MHVETIKTYIQQYSSNICAVPKAYTGPSIEIYTGHEQNSMFHKLARWLVEISNPYRKSNARFSIKDIDQITINDNQMFSVDVQSLLTNGPLPEKIY